ncbi:nitrogen regulatory protein P-II [Dehalogenimonas formicexedens]|uniref:Nitrogen regulatory protein P-II n=1 Tax=Dehalogenimonas formicexedens TaxID=1839801 RepID=A0A1P8F7D5_9CHLR|nr:P-II family nitrogen regulator [Dehalogenimonas formicexedens]APV44387.1 nitrogen regulatory protein P-II [Dehalogenimonas formicexedens]
MKKIEAVIREERLDAVKKALEEHGIHGMTVTEVSGRGQQKGISLQWRVGEYRVDFLPKLKIEIVCHDDDCDIAVDSIMKAAKTGRIGDGKIFVMPVEAAFRIRTGETGESVV